MPLLREVDRELLQKADEPLGVMYTPEWLSVNDPPRPHLDQVKIREGVYLIQNMFNTPGGRMWVPAVKEDEKLHDVYIAGDFFFYPAESLPDLERAVDGISSDERAVQTAVEEFYPARSVESPGLQPVDLAKALFPTA